MLKIHKTGILYFGFLFAFSLIISASLTNTKVALAVDSQISGVISDSSSSPISNASIDVIDTTTNQIVVSTSSDNSGNYSVLVANGTYNIVVSPPGSTSYGPAVYNNLVLSSNKIVNFVLVSAGSVSVTGHIYSSTGQALPDQLVRLYPAGSSTPIPSTTDSNGYYSLQVSPGNFYFTIEPVSNTVSSYDIPQFYRITLENFSITQSRVLDVTIPFKKVDVHIQNTSGDPVSGIRVDATTPNLANIGSLNIGGGITNAAGDSRYGYTLPGPNTDALGNVTLWLLPNDSNKSYTIKAIPPSGSIYSPFNLTNVVVSGDSQQTIVLPTPVSLTGHIYSSTGQALPDQLVRLYPAGSAIPIPSTTDPNGYYSLQVSPGTYYLSIEPVSNALSSFDIPQFYRITAENFTISQNQVLDFTIPFKKVDVHIQNSSGDPVSGIRVNATTTTGIANIGSLNLGNIITNAQGDSRYGYTLPGPNTDASGNVTLWLLPNSSSKSYTISAIPPSGSIYSPINLTNFVVTGDTQQTIVLPSPVSLTGHIYSSTGQALPDQLVRLYPIGSATPIPSTTDSNGYYSLQVSAGNYYFSLEPVSNAVSSYDIPQFYRITIDNFSVTQSQVLDITLPFKKVDVHIQNTSGDPVSGIRVDATTTTGLANSALSIGGGITNAVGDSRYGYTLPGPNTDASGNVTLWLLANSSNKSYTIKAIPPSGSIYSPFNLTNVVVSGDQAEIVSLQFIHDRPVTTINLTPLANQQGYYSDPTTITFSATAASGYSIANTYYTLDGGAQQTYTGPFNVTGSGEHTIIYWSVDNAGVPEAPNTQAFTIAPPNITTTSLSVTTVGANYSETLTVEGGTSPYSWTVSLGSLPNGLTLNNSTGEIAGVSTLAGSYDFTVQVVDNNGQIATQDLTIVVYPAPVINELVLSDATEEATYSQQLTATGGTGPIAWSVTSGSLPSGLAINSSTGELSGSPTLAGSYIFTIEVTDSNSISGAQEYTLVVNPPLSIVTNSLSTGTETASYSQTIATSGGTNPISWSLSSGSLPAGLSLNASSGEIAGTPTTAGTYNFEVQVSDVNGSTDAQSFSIIINPELDLSTSGNLADATVGYAYSQTMSVSGGTAPITWSLYDGSLPDGLSLNSSTGTISGTPTQVGTYNFTVQVTDANNQTAMQGQSIVVNSLPIISTTVLQNATLNGFYNQQVVVDGGSDSYIWSVISGSLPAGMSLGSSTGVISGTPTSPGNYSFTVQVIDSYGATATQVLSITVNQAPQIVRPSLPGKKVGQNYSQSVIVTGGAPALVWFVGSGNLPTGLSLDSSTGVISGTPTVAGSYNFNIVVTDANGVSDNRNYTIEINP